MTVFGDFDRRSTVWFLAWASACVAFTLLSFSYAAIGAGPALLLGVWHATITLGVWAIAARIVHHTPWPDNPGIGFILRHAGVAMAIALAWALLDLSTFVILSDPLLEGPLERFPVIDAIEDFLDTFEDSYSDEPVILLFRLLSGATIYLGFAGAHYLMAAQSLSANAELQALRAQLNPHFLFNTLHTISSMMRKDAVAAEAAVESLGDMLRYVLKERGSEFVSFAEEWAFTGEYLKLQAQRYETVRVETQVQPEAMAALIPPITLQPVVENCFRHGGFTERGDAHIAVKVEVDSRRLRIVVADTGAGGRGAPMADESGIGLSTLRRRLLRLYGNRAHLDAGPSPEGGYRVTIDIPTAQKDA